MGKFKYKLENYANMFNLTVSQVKKALKKTVQLIKQMKMYKIDLIMKSNNETILSFILIHKGNLTNKDLKEGIRKAVYFCEDDKFYRPGDKLFNKFLRMVKIRKEEITLPWEYKVYAFFDRMEYFEDKDNHKLYQVVLTPSFDNWRLNDFEYGYEFPAVQEMYYHDDPILLKALKMKKFKSGLIGKIKNYYVYSCSSELEKAGYHKKPTQLDYAYLDIGPLIFRDYEKKLKHEKERKEEIKKYFFSKKPLDKTFNALVIDEGDRSHAQWEKMKVKAPNVYLAILSLVEYDDWKNVVYENFIVEHKIKKTAKEIANSKKLIKQIKSNYYVKQHNINGKKVYSFEKDGGRYGVIAQSPIPEKYLLYVKGKEFTEYY